MTAPVPPPLVELSARLARYPADRYPMQHATTSFQLGFALTEAGRFPEAERALAVAAELFGPDRLPTEHAKAVNARGAALRAAGQFDEAAECFRAAAAGFERADLPLERGAALFNLGLVRRELGEDPVETFRQARELLDADRVPGHAAAAARELGAALLTAGDTAGAVEVLAEAVALAERARDLAGLGAALNTLGLAQLGEARPQDAVAAFVGAAGAHPRSVRPEGYAMAKANLALAYERQGEPVRARLAARQALGVTGTPPAVHSTASGVLERVGPGPGELLDVLDLEPAQLWPGLVSEELVRWSDTWPEERAMEADAFVDGLLARPAVAAEVVATWLGGLLELPPASMSAVVVAVLHALRDRRPEGIERFRALVARGCARFHVPQMERLTLLFEELAAQHGGPSSWR
jgi:tetratricopeptide (TPR) repeat protein